MATIEELKKRKSELEQAREKRGGELDQVQAEIAGLRERAGAQVLKGGDPGKLSAELAQLQNRAEMLEDALNLAASELVKVSNDLAQAERQAAQAELTRLRANRDTDMGVILKSVIELRAQAAAFVSAERAALDQVSRLYPGPMYVLDNHGNLLAALETALDNYLARVKVIAPDLLGIDLPTADEIRRIEAANQVKRIKERVSVLGARLKAGWESDIEHRLDESKSDLAIAERRLADLQ